MSLQDLPPELIAHILAFLPDLFPSNATAVVGANTPLTPAVCRASHLLRREALSLYAAHASFSIQIDDALPLASPRNRVRAWLDALGSEAVVGKVRCLQLSRHWVLPRPRRGEGHVGFYVRMQMLGGGRGGDGGGLERIRLGKASGFSRDEWSCTVGTYPFANDTRGMRTESVNLLRQVVLQRLARRNDGAVWDASMVKGLSRADVEFVVRAMEVVATHPIDAFDIEQSEQGRRARRKVWESIESKLWGLTEEGGISIATDGDEGGQTRQGSRFFTPY